MRRFKTVLLAVLCVSLLFPLTIYAQGQDQLAAIKQAGVLKFGTSADYIPFVFADGTTLDGLDIALVNEIGKRIGVKVESIDMAFDGLIDALTIGQVDLIGGALAITPERQKKIDFSRAYYEGKGIIIAKSDSSLTNVETLETAATLQVGVEKGSTFDQWVNTNLLQSGFIQSKNVFDFAKVSDVFNALDQGVIDIAVVDEDVYKSKYQTSGKYKIINDKVTKESYGFAAVKGSTLIPAVNQALNEMIADGTAQQIANKYFLMKFDDAPAPSITRPSQITTEIEKKQEIALNTNCTNGMQFIIDLSIPDGTAVNVGTSFVKTWRIKNTGSCVWNSNYSFNYVSGDNLGNSSVGISQNVEPGKTYDISINFTAPSYNGSFVSKYQMRADNGLNFGETIWANFRSINAVQTQNSASANGAVVVSWQPDKYSAYDGICPVVYWVANNADYVEFYIDNQYVGRANQLSGNKLICPPGVGTFNYAVRAVGTNAASVAFQFTNLGGEKKNPSSAKPTPVPTKSWVVSPK